MADLSITAANVLPVSEVPLEIGTAGAAIAAGEQVYLSSATNKWLLADSNSATAEARKGSATALCSAAADQPIVVGKGGKVNFGAVLTVGATYYLSATPGKICPAADLATGMYPQVVGMAETTSVMKLSYATPGVALP
jgi:predicted lysophospholipase L1 biosynthesis ABC-type transport system permease subunit